SCAPRLPPASAAVRSPAPAARSHPKTGPIAAARMPLPAPTPRRDGSDLPHSSKLECHDLLNLSSPFALMPVFTLLPNGKHWHLQCLFDKPDFNLGIHDSDGAGRSSGGEHGNGDCDGDA